MNRITPFSAFKILYDGDKNDIELPQALPQASPSSRTTISAREEDEISRVFSQLKLSHDEDMDESDDSSFSSDKSFQSTPSSHSSGPTTSPLNVQSVFSQAMGNPSPSFDRSDSRSQSSPFNAGPSPFLQNFQSLSNSGYNSPCVFNTPEKNDVVMIPSSPAGPSPLSSKRQPVINNNSPSLSMTPPAQRDVVLIPSSQAGPSPLPPKSQPVFNNNSPSLAQTSSSMSNAGPSSSTPMQPTFNFNVGKSPFSDVNNAASKADIVMGNSPPLGPLALTSMSTVKPGNNSAFLARTSLSASNAGSSSSTPMQPTFDFNVGNNPFSDVNNAAPKTGIEMSNSPPLGPLASPPALNHGNNSAFLARPSLSSSHAASSSSKAATVSNNIFGNNRPSIVNNASAHQGMNALKPQIRPLAPPLATPPTLSLTTATDSDSSMKRVSFLLNRAPTPSLNNNFSSNSASSSNAPIHRNRSPFPVRPSPSPTRLNGLKNGNNAASVSTKKDDSAMENPLSILKFLSISDDKPEPDKPEPDKSEPRNSPSRPSAPTPLEQRKATLIKQHPVAPVTKSPSPTIANASSSAKPLVNSSHVRSSPTAQHSSSHRPIFIAGLAKPASQSRVEPKPQNRPSPNAPSSIVQAPMTQQTAASNAAPAALQKSQEPIQEKMETADDRSSEDQMRKKRPSSANTPRAPVAEPKSQQSTREATDRLSDDRNAKRMRTKK